RIDRAARSGSGVCNGVGDGIGAEREPTDGVGRPAALIDHCERAATDEELTGSGHGREPRIDVVGGSGAAREHELTRPDGSGAKQFAQRGVFVAENHATSSRSSVVPGVANISSRARAVFTFSPSCGAAVPSFHSMNSMN